MSSLFLLGSILIGYNQCVTPNNTNKKKGTILTETNPNAIGKKVETTPGKPPVQTNVPTNNSKAAMIEAFSKSAYPLLKMQCASCHSVSQTPLLSANDINVAYESLINASKVDLANPEKSKIYLKLKNESHNCWGGSCANSSSEMLAQINKWKSLTAGTPADLNNTNVSGKLTKETLSVSEVLDPSSFSSPSTVTLMAESASLKVPMKKGLEGTTSFIYAPLDSGVKDLTAAGSLNAGTASLNFTVEMTGLYNIFMLVNAPTLSSDSLYLKMGAAGTYKDLTLASVTTGFQWRKVTNYNLTAGTSNMMEIRQKEPGLKIAKIVVTDTNYEPTAMATMLTKATLSQPLADITGVENSYFDIDVEPYDQYSYKLSNPRIRTSKDMTVKKIKVLLNGNYNPQNATFMVANSIVTKAAPLILSPSGTPLTMVILKDKGDEFDRLTFSFEVIEAVK
jgi:hypothetical protein